MHDATAMDALARRIKFAGEEGDLDNLAELVGELIKETGRSTSFTVATVANMRRFEEENPDVLPPYRAIALGLAEFEEASATAGDYWQLGDDHALVDSEGEPMILVVKKTIYVDALTGEGI